MSLEKASIHGGQGEKQGMYRINHPHGEKEESLKTGFPAAPSVFAVVKPRFSE